MIRRRNLFPSHLAVFLVTISCLFTGTKQQQCMAGQKGVSAAAVSVKTMVQLYSCDFEVFGIVQGVFFRKHTQKRATELGLKGWCMNTRDDTVKGVMEGEEKPINEMKHWLQKVGSPTSRIDKAVFGQMKPIETYSFPDFSVKR